MFTHVHVYIPTYPYIHMPIYPYIYIYNFPPGARGDKPDCVVPAT